MYECKKLLKILIDNILFTFFILFFYNFQKILFNSVERVITYQILVKFAHAYLYSALII